MSGNDILPPCCPLHQEQKKLFIPDKKAICWSVAASLLYKFFRLLSTESTVEFSWWSNQFVTPLECAVVHNLIVDSKLKMLHTVGKSSLLYCWCRNVRKYFWYHYFTMYEKNELTVSCEHSPQVSLFYINFVSFLHLLSSIIGNIFVQHQHQFTF